MYQNQLFISRLHLSPIYRHYDYAYYLFDHLEAAYNHSSSTSDRSLEFFRRFWIT
jgi:hypothetical protein